MQNGIIMIQRKSKSLEVLIIEDDTDFGDVLCKMLARRGYGVAQARTGLEGIHRFKEHPADLVITDIVLPDKDGIHVILELQKIVPEVKVIAMSGGGRCASGEEYLDDVQLYCNVKHTLAKPFRQDELLKTIRKALR